MGKKHFLWKAAAIAQVDQFTPGGTIEADDIFILTFTALDGQTHIVSFTGSATVSVITAGLKTAWDANAVTAAIASSTDNGTDIELTAVTAGVGFSVVQTTTEANGDPADAQTFGGSTTTANQGDNDLSVAENWTDGVLPTAADDVIIEGSGTNNHIKYGLDVSAWGTLATIRTSGVGIGTNPALGVLPIYFKPHVTIADINKHEGPGTVTQTMAIFLDTDNVASTITVHDGGANSGDSTIPAVWIKANHASTTITVLKGKVGIAYRDGEAAVIASIETGYVKSIPNDVELNVGEDATVPIVTLKGGDSKLNMASTATITTINAHLGTLRTEGGVAITNLNIKGAACDIRSTGTITNGTMGSGSVDTTKTKQAVTITNFKPNGGSITYGTKDSIGIIDPDEDVKLTATAE